MTTHSCQCKFWHTMHLPCRHIFAVRERTHCRLYCEELVAPRWTLDGIKAAYEVKHQSQDSESDCFEVCIYILYGPCMCMDLYSSVMGQQSCLQVTDIAQEHATRVLSQHQKFHRAQQVTHQLAALCSEGGMEEYEERLALLQLLEEKWSNGHKVTLQTQSGKS